MKYPFHLVDVFSATPFGGNQLAILPDATGISTDGMQKIAREFNFPESTFVLPKNGPAVDRAAVNRAAWTATLSRAWSPNLFFFAGDLRDGGSLYARMCAPALGVEEDPATGSACAALVGAMASKHDFGGTAYRLLIQQSVSMGRRSEIQ